MTDVWQHVRYDDTLRQFQLRSADGTVTLDFGAQFEVNDEKLSLSDASKSTGSAEACAGGSIEVQFEFENVGLSSVIEASLSEDGASVLLDCRLHNQSTEPMKLGRCCPLAVTEAVGALEFVGDDGNAVYLLSSASTDPNHVYRVDDAEAEKRSNMLLHIVSAAAGKALHLGFVSFDRMGAHHEFSYDADRRGFTELSAICDLYEWELPAGDSVALETLLVEARGDFHASLHNWADHVAAHYKPCIWPKIPGGWLGWAWVDCFNVELYQDAIVRNAQAIRRRLAGLDIEYIWQSLGNLPGGLPGAWLDWNQRHFPCGHQWLIEKLEELDFTLGLWVGPFYVANSLEEFVGDMGEALLGKQGEPAIVSGPWRHGDAGILPLNQRPLMYALDPTHPKGEAFLKHVFTTYRDWGIGYYMLDFLHAAANPDGYDEHHDKSVVRGTPVLRRGLQAIAEAAGPDTYTLSSSGPTFACTGLVSAARMANDYGEGRPLHAETSDYPATFLINRAEAWTSHVRASCNLAATYFTHRKLFIADTGNVMTVDQPISVGDAQITATIFGINGGPVMLGDDIDRMADERLELIKKVFPRYPETPTPIDLFDAPYPDYPKLFHTSIDNPWGRWDILAVLNYTAEPLVQDIPLERLGLDPANKYLVWEFWNQKYQGTVSDSLRAVVAPASVGLYRICRRPEYPCVIATDMHVLQGHFELTDVCWDTAAMTLSGNAQRPCQQKGSLFIWAPDDVRVAEPQGLWIAKDDNDKSLIIRRAFEFDGDGGSEQPWSVRFAPL